MSSIQKEEFDKLYYKHCPECDGTATSVIDTSNNKRLGWYCVCGNFIKAIGRELIWRGANEK